LGQLVKSGCTQYSKGISLTLVIFLATINPAESRDWDAKIEAACPAAAEEEARLLAARPPPKDATSVSRPALRKDLLQMEKLDQDARELLVAATATPDLPEDHPALVHMLEVDATNLKRLKHVVNQDGFPTIEMVGLDGVNAAFILTQHADPQFQAKMLPVLTVRLKDGEIPAQDYALLTDRVLRAQGRPQRYGTQFGWSEDGLNPDPIADESHVDERRSALGMMSLANYSCMLRAMYDSPHPAPAN
jgi:hypothetical protein